MSSRAGEHASAASSLFSSSKRGMSSAPTRATTAADVVNKIDGDHNDGGDLEGLLSGISPDETTPLTQNFPSSPSKGRPGDDLTVAEKARLFDEQNAAANELSTTLLAVDRSGGGLGVGGVGGFGVGGGGNGNGNDDGTEEIENEILRTSLRLDPTTELMSEFGLQQQSSKRLNRRKSLLDAVTPEERGTMRRVGCMAVLTVLIIIAVIVVGEYTVKDVPKRQPVGPYRLVEAQEGESFFDFYNVYDGVDSAGSNGYNTYVTLADARAKGVVKILREPIIPTKQQVHDGGDDGSTNTAAVVGGGGGGVGGDVSRTNSSTSAGGEATDGKETTAAAAATSAEGKQTSPVEGMPSSSSSTAQGGGGAGEDEDDDDQFESFVYMGSAPTREGPRDSVRLEGKRRFSRGLFVLDVRHMPAGCGTWPAFWLTDENNWPVNGEIDILEGVNYQSVAKTALHASRECTMYDVPEGIMSGGWDTAIGVPDAKTGKPDMTLRYAKNCYVYDPHQWLNQGCVAVDAVEGRMGIPLNNNGGGVYVLEWDPINRHIRSWVFTPHAKMPDNLRDAIRTANQADKIMPDPTLWEVPYGYFAIGENTECPESHFKNMHLVINLAFCGSVAGNRFFMDCPNQFKKFKTCNEWVKSDPDELKEAYWKIRGVYVYEREWVRAPLV